ncbi:NAD-dependent epimerase/dehydratase family protein [Fodinicola acaciae]|uniref:NAD-dependent epimerase/dehydratase family protein n=1 Tax=Fodinicola acaciae TaxID=2681555 RepID=UPI0013D1F74C|nr:NAD-dependent epimerase/dehydratase family protein [Fodinicola acaciae]
MRILVLGGTAFVGRAIVEEALRNGDEVTIFGRGRTGTELFPGVERRIGDRDTDDYASLENDGWDAVVDVSGYVTRHVDRAMEVLGDRVGRYLFVSSHAVYQREGIGPDNDEDTPRRVPVRDPELLTEDTYGPAKVACEDDIVARYGDRATIVRPCKVAGPHDESRSFPHWVREAARGGRVELPGDPDQPSQIVDVRDVAVLVRKLLADGRPGAYNAAGPADPVTLAGLIQVCAEVAGTTVEIVPVAERPGPPYFPLVRPKSMWSTQQRSMVKARAAGLPATPLAVTAKDVLASLA